MIWCIIQRERETRVKQKLKNDFAPPLIDSHSLSINPTATAAMAGGIQLVEEAHLTGGYTRFCRKASKCRNHAVFGGEIIKCAL